MSEVFQFSSPATHEFPFPSEIAHLVVAEFCVDINDPTDRAALDTLSKSAPLFRNICQSLLFRRVSFNFQHRNIQKRIEQFKNLLCDNPLLATFVHSLQIFGDNISENMVSSRTKIPLEESDMTKWCPYSASLYEEDSYQVFSEAEGLGAQFASDLKKLNNLQDFRISFLYRPLEWMQFSVHFQRMLRTVFQQPYLRILFIQGLKGVPQGLLERFSSLRKLSLLNISIDPTAKILDHPDDVMTDIYKPIGCRMLRTLTLRDVPSEGALSLMACWRKDADSGHPGINMARPHTIDIYFGNHTECRVSTTALRQTSVYLRQLMLDTLTLGFEDTAFLNAMTKGATSHPSIAYPTPASWFADVSRALIDPNEMRYLRSLKDLNIRVSHWPVGIAAENNELKWALALLERVPTKHLETVVITIKLLRDSRAVAYFLFHIEDIFMPWSSELQKDKWTGLKKLTLRLQLPHEALNEDPRGFNASIPLLVGRISDMFARDAFTNRKTNFFIHTFVKSDTGIIQQQGEFQCS